MATDQNLIDALAAIVAKAQTTASSSTPEELVYLGKALEAVGPASTTRYIVEIGESERARVIAQGDAKITELTNSLKTLNGESLVGGGDIVIEPAIGTAIGFAYKRYQDNWQTHTSTGGAHVSGLDITYTPQYANSRIVITYSIHNDGHQDMVWKVKRDGGWITSTDGASYNTHHTNNYRNGITANHYDNNVDSTPSTLTFQYTCLAENTNARTYQPWIYGAGSNRPMAINRSWARWDANGNDHEMGFSVATLQEFRQ